MCYISDIKQVANKTNCPTSIKTLNFKFNQVNAMTYYDEDFDYYPECQGCDNKREALNTAQDLLKEVVKRLYIPGKFKKEEFESILDELCTCLKVEIMYQPIQVESKTKKITDIICEKQLNKCA